MASMHRWLGVGLAWLAIVQSRPAPGREILLIDDLSAGFGSLASLLEAQGHNVTELTDEVLAGYSRVADASYLSGFDFVIYSARSSTAPPAAANTALEAYIQGGGDLLVTGFSYGTSVPDRSAPDLLRALGPEFGYSSSQSDHLVLAIDNYITNGPHGDYRGAVISNSHGFAQLFANTGLGTVPLVQATGGQPDKIIFTDLPGAGGSIGAWQGDQFYSPFGVAQPEFLDGGTFQGLLLNWAEGGSTTQTQVTPRVFSTAHHPLASAATLDLYLGDPDNGGTFAATLGSINVAGTIDVVGSLNGLGDGTLALTGARLMVDDVTNRTADFGFLGTIDVDISNLVLYIANQTAAVAGGAFDLTAAPYYVAGIDHGSFLAHSPTGAMAVLLDGLVPIGAAIDELFYGGPGDFPSGVFEGTYDRGLGGFTPHAEVNLTIDNAALRLFAIDGLGDIYGVVRGDFHVALVPEPSSLALAALGAGGLCGVCALRRRRARGDW